MDLKNPQGEWSCRPTNKPGMEVNTQSGEVDKFSRPRLLPSSIGLFNLDFIIIRGIGHARRIYTRL